MHLYLDIETDFYQNITVIGFYSESTGFRQIVGRDITRARLSRRLPKPINSTDGESIGMGLRELYTFNGHCFDLPVIKKRLGLDLREKYDSKDLRFICKKHGLAGGQKIIEKMLGIRRELPDMDGRDALYLWQNYTEYGDEASLSTNTPSACDGVIHEYLQPVRGAVRVCDKFMGGLDKAINI